MPRPLDISVTQHEDTTPKAQGTALPVRVEGVALNPKQQEVAQQLDRLKQSGAAIYYETYGKWSNYHLADEIIRRCGKGSRVWIKSYNFTRKSAELFANLKAGGYIAYLHATLDHRMVTAEHNAYGVIQTVADRVHLTSNHAKLLLVVGREDSYLVSNSANYTENRRNENGIIIRQPDQLISIIETVEYGTDSCTEEGN